MTGTQGHAPRWNFRRIRNLSLRAKKAIKKTFLANAYIFIDGMFVKPCSQGDEAQIIKRLGRRFEIPHSFVEFGLSGWEFNCASLVGEWDGLLVDGDEYNVRIGNIVFPRRITVKRAWLMCRIPRLMAVN